MKGRHSHLFFALVSIFLVSATTFAEPRPRPINGPGAAPVARPAIDMFKSRKWEKADLERALNNPDLRRDEVFKERTAEFQKRIDDIEKLPNEAEKEKARVELARYMSGSVTGPNQAKVLRALGCEEMADLAAKDPKFASEVKTTVGNIEKLPALPGLVVFSEGSGATNVVPTVPGGNQVNPAANTQPIAKVGPEVLNSDVNPKKDAPKLADVSPELDSGLRELEALCKDIKPEHTNTVYQETLDRANGIGKRVSEGNPEKATEAVDPSVGSKEALAHGTALTARVMAKGTVTVPNAQEAVMDQVYSRGTNAR